MRALPSLQDLLGALGEPFRIGQRAFRLVEPLDAVTADVPPFDRIEDRAIRLQPDWPRTGSGVITR
jgi:hypothetical protein